MESTKGSQFARSAGLVAAGTAAGQAVLFISSIAIARLFTPAEIGAYVAMSAVAAILAIFLTGRYELAIPIPAQHEEAATLGRLGLALAAASSLAVGAILVIVPDEWWPTGLGNPRDFAWAVPALSLGLAILQIANQLAVRARLYSALAMRAMLYPMIAGTLQVIAGIMNFGVGALVLGVFAGQVVAATAAWIASSRTLRSKRSDYVTGWHIARTYWTFPIFLAPAGALNALATQFPTLAIATLFGVGVGGQFGMAIKLLAAPVALLGQTIGYVYAGEVAHSDRAGASRSSPLFFKTSSALLIIASAMALALVLVSEPLFVALLGERWRMSGQFAVAISVGVCAQLVASPTSQTLIIAGFGRTQFMLDLLRVILIAAAAGIAHQTNQAALSAAWSISVAVAIGYALMWSANLYAAKRMDSGAASS